MPYLREDTGGPLILQQSRALCSTSGVCAHTTRPHAVFLRRGPIIQYFVKQLTRAIPAARQAGVLTVPPNAWAASG
jgi:hypothetical protein